MVTKVNPIAPLYTLRKDHKVCYCLIVGLKGRPVCGAIGCLSERFSYLISWILDKIWQYLRNDTVCMSTEELLADINELNNAMGEGNRRVRGGRKLIVGSADVKALYPSLDIDFTVKVVAEMLENCGIEIDGINYKEMGLYLVFNMSR